MARDLPRIWREIDEPYGVPLEAIVAGIRNGVRKINIDTDLHLAMSAASRRLATTARSEFAPRKFFKAAKEATEGICIARFEAFGTAGRAGHIKPVPLERMARNYLARAR